MDKGYSSDAQKWDAFNTLLNGLRRFKGEELVSKKANPYRKG